MGAVCTSYHTPLFTTINFKHNLMNLENFSCQAFQWWWWRGVWHIIQPPTTTPKLKHDFRT